MRGFPSHGGVRLPFFEERFVRTLRRRRVAGGEPLNTKHDRFGRCLEGPVAAIAIGAMMLIVAACGGFGGGGPIAATSTGSVVMGGSHSVVGALATLYETGTAGHGNEPLILASTTSGAGDRFPNLWFTCTSRRVTTLHCGRWGRRGWR